MTLSDWIKDKLKENGMDRQKVYELYEQALSETGSTCSEKTFKKNVWTIYTVWAGGKSRPESIKEKDLAETYKDFSRDYLLEILTEEVKAKGEKISPNQMKQIAEDRDIPYGAFLYYLPDISDILKTLYRHNLIHIEQDVKEEGYKEQLSLLKRENKVLKKDEARFQLFINSIERAVEEYEPFPAPNIIRNSLREDLITQVLLSDAHWGEDVNGEELQGLNEYNTGIAKKRLDKYFNNVLEYCETIGSNVIDLNLLGDNISGRIHNEILEHTADPTVITVMQFSDYTAQWIKELSKFVKVRKVRSVPGNHGRFDVKPSFKNKAYNNHEFYLSHFIKKEVQHLVDDFIIPPSLIYVENIFETGIAFLHGDMFKGGTGLSPVSGTWGRDVAKLNGIYSKTDMPFDIITFGHFHTGDQILPSFDGTKIIVNGSIKGLDEFALSVVKSNSRANQSLFSIEKGKKGEVKFFQTIFLD